MILLGSYIIWANYENQKKEAYHATLQEAAAHASAIEQNIDRAKTLAMCLANTPALKALDIENSEQLFKSFHPYQQGIINLWITDTTGKPIVAYPLNKNHGVIYNDRDYFKAAMSGQTVVTDSLIGGYTKIPVVIIATPIRNYADTIVGMMVITLQPLYFYNNLDQQHSNQLFIMDSQSNILFYPESETFVPASSEAAKHYQSLFNLHSQSVFAAATPLGNEAIIASAKVAGSNWKIVVIREEQIIDWYFKNVITPVLVFLLTLAPIFLIVIQNEKLRFKYQQGLLLQKLSVAETDVERALLTKELAASVAHEVRNPLTSIIGFIQFMIQKNTNERQAEFLRIILGEARQVETLVSEFLQFAKSNMGQISNDYELCDLEAIIKEIELLIQSMTGKKSIVVEYSFQSNLPPVRISKAEFKQVLINLVKNAIEATDSQGQILISAYIDNAAVCLDISDTGSGIAEEIHNKIGQRFFTTKKTGTGLGIAICQRILQNHRGSLSFKNNPDKGATFTIHLPIEL